MSSSDPSIRVCAEVECLSASSIRIVPFSPLIGVCAIGIGTWNADTNKVKADRGEIDASQDKIEQLQKETEKLAQKKR